MRRGGLWPLHNHSITLESTGLPRTATGRPYDIGYVAPHINPRLPFPKKNLKNAVRIFIFGGFIIQDAENKNIQRSKLK